MPITTATFTRTRVAVGKNTITALEQRSGQREDTESPERPGGSIFGRPALRCFFLGLKRVGVADSAALTAVLAAVGSVVEVVSEGLIVVVVAVASEDSVVAVGTAVVALVVSVAEEGVGVVVASAGFAAVDGGEGARVSRVEGRDARYGIRDISYLASRISHPMSRLRIGPKSNRQRPLWCGLSAVALQFRKDRNRELSQVCKK